MTVPDNLIINEETMPVITQLAESMPGGFFIYYAHGDQELIYFNSHMPAFFGCESEEEFRRLTRNSFKGLVHPEDYEATEAEIQRQIRLSDKGIDHVQYRIIRKDKSVRILDDYGHFEHSGTFGDIFYVFVQDITLNEKRNRDYQKVIGVLAQKYSLVCLIDVQTNKEVIFKADEERTSRITGWDNITNFTDRLVRIRDTFVHPEDRQTFQMATRKKQILKELHENGSCSVMYRSVFQDELSYWRIDFSLVDMDTTQIVAGFRDITLEVQEQNDMLEATQEKERLIENLMNSYYTLFRVNLSDASYTIVKMDDGTIGKEMEFANFLESREFFVSQVAYEPDREMLRYELDFATMRKKLQSAPRYTVEYRIVVDGAARWYEMVISSLGDDEVAIAFALRDAEILNEHICKVLMDSYEGIYVVNLNTDQLKILKATGITKDRPQIASNSALLRELSERLTGEAKEYFLAISDPEYLRDMLKRERNTEFFYQSPNYDGQYVWLKTEVHVLTWVDDMPETAVIIISGVDSVQREKIELNEQLVRQNIINTFFLEPYTAACYVGLEDHSCKVFKRADEMERRYPLTTVFPDMLMDPIEHDVVPEDREKLKELVNPEVIREKLRSQNGFSYTFRTSMEDGQRFYLMNIIRGADDVHAALIIRELTNEYNEQKRRLRETEDTRKLIESVASVYRFAFSVDMSDGSYRPIRMDQEVKDFLHGVEFTCYADVIKPLFWALHPMDRERMKKELEFDTIREKLKKTPAYNVEYRTITNGATNWHEMNITHIVRDEIAMGFGAKDMEITKRHLADYRFADYFALYEVDIETGLMKVVIDSPYYSIGKPGTAVPYQESMQAYASTIGGEGGNFFKQIADIAYVKNALSEEGSHTYAYRNLNSTRKQWVDCTGYVTCRYADGSPSMFILGFSFMDANASARQDLKYRISEQKKQLEAQQEQLMKALSEAQAANNAKTEFLFNMSHDIRTPMNAILGFTQMALRNLENREKVVQCLEKAWKSGNLLLTLINGILDMTAVENANAVSEEQVLDLYRCFDGIESVMQEEAAKSGILLTFSFGEIRNRYVYMDISRCLRILTNLVINSIKYAKPNGYVRVNCEQATPPHDGRATYRFTVEDNGIGMSEDFQQHMFEPFAREQNSTQSGIQGTGLGLSICKTFVDTLGGTIDCRSTRGIGTTFIVMLPLKVCTYEAYEAYISEGNAPEVYASISASGAQLSTSEVQAPASGTKAPASGTKAPATEAQAHTSESNRQTKPGTEDDELLSQKGSVVEQKKPVDFRGKRALIVDDNELNREIAADILEERGIETETAEDGSVAVKLLQEIGPDYYDFILMDIQMPVMNGHDAARAILSMYPDAHIPILAVSANAFPQDKQASLAAGMVGHIPKPINLHELFSCLEKYL